MRIIFILLFSTLLFSSCKKLTTDEITYEVTLINSTTWHGSYLNERAEVIGLEDAPSRWKYTFKNSKNLAVATLLVYTDGLNASKDAIMKIYVNGVVMVSGQYSISPQVQYILP